MVAVAASRPRRCLPGGCTKLVPGSMTDFGADKTVVVTLRDGETIKGHIAKGEQVTFTTFGRVYRAGSSDGGQVRESCSPIPTSRRSTSAIASSASGCRAPTLHVRDNTERISIPAYKIVKVEEVTIDKMKSTRAGGFWAFTVFVLAKILSARL